MNVKLTNKILITCLVILLLVFSALWLFLKAGRGGYKRVCIKKGNKVAEEIDINSLKEEVYEINLETNTVCITKDGVYMREANCPDKLCVHSGLINKAGQSIVCLPNKIIVEITDGINEVDAVAGAR